MGQEPFNYSFAGLVHYGQVITKEFDMGSNTWVHGHAQRGNHSLTYETWTGMKKRCNAPNTKCYKYYGGRGIKVCDRWQNSFANFVADMGEQPIGLSIDRIDNNGPYAPWNCRWATRKEQRNNRSDSKLVTAFGQTKTIHEWADYKGLPYNTLYLRLRRGWDVSIALTRPYNDR
tara:strand:- start:26848 stop:27369 length:522 start_codon:yes stop_codon:yes gene_type:complete